MGYEQIKIGAAQVEYGDVAGGTGVLFDVTQGGIQFTTSTTVQGVTTDQTGEAPVKEITRGTTAQVTVPFMLHDLEKLASVIPNSTLVTDSVDATKMKIEVKSNAGYDLMANAKQLVVKPTAAGATANEWITIPLAGARTDLELTYDSENPRLYNVTFVGYPDYDLDGLLYIIGDETATA
jgi:hypothetical protein